VRLRRIVGRVAVDGPYKGREFVFRQEFSASSTGQLDLGTLLWATEEEVDGAILHGAASQVAVVKELQGLDVDPRRLQIMRLGQGS
jgi:hypothetical protein